MSEAEARDQGAAEQTQHAAETIARASGEVIRETSERLGGSAREGMRQASAASSAGAEAAMRTTSSLAEGMQDITKAWAHYAEEVMRQTSEASRALIGCRSLTEMFEIQSELLRGNLQAFLDQSGKIAEIAGRLATQPFEAVKRVSEVPLDR
ncbi:MAG TPA: phasin family protein [Stellaceae bacterium]|nr:phasin family protein [Stellaceae bacterium]